ncbi:amino acid ABC transporter permease [Solibacillus silvestris]|uniref:amino acid ABC transporter permease n=1 Tax=Solibacillus silvestris TaxID=76853 RepID=UPI003F809124
MQLDFTFIMHALKELSKVIPFTLSLAFTPIVLGFVIGLLIAFIRMSDVKILKACANFYVSFYRGTPVIMHIFIIYFGFTSLAQELFSFSLNAIPLYVFVLIALTLNAGAFLSEIIRSGILSVSKGQIEAAQSIGMTMSQVFARIIFPQAIVAAIPNLTNICTAFLHATSIAFLISVTEITGTANIIAASNLKFLEAFIAAAIIYWLISILIELISAKIEQKVTKHVRSGVVQNA